MWPFKKIQLAGPDEFPAVVESLIEKLRIAGFGDEADRIHHVVHELLPATSNEFYGELSLALKTARKRHALPRDISAEIRRLLKSIGRICRWR
jgi:hypothetical protein